MAKSLSAQVSLLSIALLFAAVRIVPATSTAVDVSITPSGTGTAGESYSLECTVIVTGSTNQPTIIWLDPMNNIITSGVETTGNTSTLTFNRLAASHAGTYTCSATLGCAMDSGSTTITVQNPVITVSVASNVSTPVVGSMFSLTCTVTGAERLTDAGAIMVTYQWLKNGAVIPDQTMTTLSFFPLTFSDAGSYTCQATFTSTLLADIISLLSANSIPISLMYPTITVSVSSSVSTPMVGSVYSLTCTITGAERLTDAGAMVTYQWLKNGAVVSDQTMAALSFSPLTFSDAGRYTCQMTITSSLLRVPDISHSINSVGITPIVELLPVYLSLGGIHIANNSNVSFYSIGEGDGGALLCVTDLMQCCHRKNTATGRALGWWFYPDGSDVPTYEYHNIYRDRGRNIVRLNHRNYTHVEPTGLYCCEVPDSTFTAQRLCANIVYDISWFTTSACGLSCASTETADKQMSTVLSTCSIQVGAAMGALILVESIGALMIIFCWLTIRKRKSGKKDFAVSENKAYHGQVNLDYLGGVNTSAASGDNEMYEDPDRMVKTGCRMMGTYIPS